MKRIKNLTLILAFITPIAVISLSGCKKNETTATCTDGIKNGTETGVDCGGSCTACNTATCNNGVKDGNETGIDCGGSCTPCGTATCSDGLMNGTESGVDCGGSCTPCAANKHLIKTETSPNYGGTSTTLTNTFTYDEKGRVSKIKAEAFNTTSYLEYYYSTNKVTEIRDNADTTVYILNAAGYAITQDGSFYANYDNDGHALQIGNTENVWNSSGNIDSVFLGTSDIAVYQYDLSKLNTIGNENHGQLFFGKSEVNLVDSFTRKLRVNNQVISTGKRYFQFDSQGRVSQEVLVDGTPVTIYTYY